jgi:hypothetical protein
MIGGDRSIPAAAEEDRVNEERGIGAMPKLYGAPAYARPPVQPVNPIDRPFDPDDLPLEAERTDEDAQLVNQLQGHAYDTVATADPLPAGHDGSTKLHGRPFRLRLPGRGQAGR